MGIFRKWLESEDRNNKLIAMRRWLWNQEHGKKGAQSPVTEDDPDYEWIKNQSERLGPLDPYKHWELKD